MSDPSVLSLIGGTPTVRLQRLPNPDGAEVWVKLESQNPAGSVKDRIALAMIEAAEQEGRLKPGDTIVEPTSGNTGIGLALVAAVKGYRLIITMPDDSSPERRALLAHYGAEVVLTPARKLMRGAIDRAEEIATKNPGCFMPAQFRNPANPDAHRTGTALEILEQMERRLDVFVAGVGTGGTITGVGEVLKRELPGLQVVAVEPELAAAITNRGDKRAKMRAHSIQGIGAGFVPAVFDDAVIDEVAAVADGVAFDCARDLARHEGISAGPSGGAAVAVALEKAAVLEAGQRVLTIIPDRWDRYIALPSPPKAIGALDFII